MFSENILINFYLMKFLGGRGGCVWVEGDMGYYKVFLVNEICILMKFLMYWVNIIIILCYSKIMLY